MLEQDAETYGFSGDGIFYEVAPEEAEKSSRRICSTTGSVGSATAAKQKSGGRTEARVWGRWMQRRSFFASRATGGCLPAAAGEAALEEGWRDRFDPALQVGAYRVTVDLPAGEVQPGDHRLCAGLPGSLARLSGCRPRRTVSRRAAFRRWTPGSALPSTRHAMVCVTQFNKQENPETAFKGVARTIGKNADSYFLTRNVYQSRGYNKIFGLMQRILLILLPVIAVAAAVFRAAAARAAVL
ncbi:MAG: hypothetical protein V8Q43_04440 [Christensenellaceae bacterium]